MPKILKCPSIWISSSSPYLEGAMARCYAITTNSVSGWVSSCIQFWWRIFKFLFQMDYTTPNTKVFSYNIQAWSCKPRFLPNTEWEPLGKNKADKGRRQSWTLSTGNYPKWQNQSRLSKMSAISFINKLEAGYMKFLHG